MRLKINFPLLVGALLAASCSSSVDEEQFPPGQVDTNFAIIPSTGLGNLSATRGEGIVAPDASTDLNVSVFRVNQYDNNGTVEYPTDFTTTQTSGPWRAKLLGNTINGEADAQIRFAYESGVWDDRQYYLSDGKHTKVLAVYPRIAAADWLSSAATVAYTIDGSTDVMATGWGEGYKDLTKNPAEPVHPTGMNFSHLFTQVQVRVFAVDETARAYWGDIESISVNNRKNKCLLTLPAISTSGYPTLSIPADATDVALPLTALDGSAAPTIVETDIPLTNTTDDPAITFGYCMFAPVTTAGTLPLTVVTDKGGVKTTTSVLVATERTYAAGTSYIIALKLLAQEIIPTAVTVSPWTPQDLGEIGI